MTPAELNVLPSPQFWRRISCGLYEQLLLLGVIAFTLLLPIFGIVIMLKISMPPGWLIFLYLYVVLGFYYVWYWTRSGQTLAMQTWRVRLIDRNGQTLKRQKAILRYITGSLWVIPWILLQWLFNFEKWQFFEMLFAVALFLWPLTIYLDRKSPLERQGLPDRFAGTRLVELPKNRVTLS